jgi:tetratricopeptide (TPR) repeat protein
MKNIALRTYQRNVELWIEENKIDKAIFQSFLLLQKFPKNLHTYQILSKGLLQKQDFVTADKVFDIILQIDPDDFVSHIGKSIIAENNNNLANAIDHMKFAFELQPSNEGLQNELKKLLLAKDGVEPNKIQLTRGALLKMYMDGKLYQQAIAEAKIGLSETPQRVDYKIALAKSCFESGDNIQAVEICVEIVSKLPYCWAANDILDQIITNKHSIQKDDFYHIRLIELDAYHAFMLPSTQSIFDVPDIAVLVEDETDVVEFDYNLDSLIENTWSDQNKLNNLDNNQSVKVDWDAIINKAVESNILQSNSHNNQQINQFKMNTFQNQDNKMPTSRKKVFLNRLRPAKSSEANSENIPDWFFDESGEITHFDNELTLNESENIQKSDASTLEPIENSNSTKSEDGIFDTDIQPAINNKTELDQSKTVWQSDEDNLKSMSLLNPILDDTQPILIVKDNSNDLLLNSEKALEGGNTKYALYALQNLISEKKNLPEVANQLEKAIELYPERCDFRMLLGETYTILEEKEKALLIFKNAQKFVSL